MKYFFLAEDWKVGRVWELGGLWNEMAWRRKPQIDRITLGIVEQGQKLRLYQVEDAVLMVEVLPIDDNSSNTSPANPTHATIGQVVLKRLITAEQVIEQFQKVEQIYTAR